MRSSWKPSGRSGPTAEVHVDLRRRPGGDGVRRRSTPVTARPARSRPAGRSRSPTAARRGWPGRCRPPAAATSAAAGLPAHRASAARRPLRRMAKAASTTAKVAARSPGGGGRRTRATRPESTLGSGQNTRRPDVAGPADLAVPGGLDRGHAVGRAAGRRGQPVGHLGLHQDQRPVQRGQQLQQVQQHRDGDVVGQVGDQRGRRRPGQLGDRAARRRSTTVSRSARSGRRSATVARQQRRPAAGRSRRR